MYTKITKDVGEAVRIIRGGRLVAFPTGTSYGLAADALQGYALQRLRSIKQRPDERTFTVFLKESLWDEYFDITEQQRSLLQAMANKPLTLLVTPKDPLAHLAQDGRVGLRVIDHPLMEALAQAAEVPLTATSANVSGEEPAYSPDEVIAQFPGKLNPATASTRLGLAGLERAGDTTYDLSLGCILGGGTLPKRRPTTVAKLANGEVEIIREGALDAATINSEL